MMLQLQRKKRLGNVKNIKNHLKASLWMVFGLFFVFSTVIIMNKDSSIQGNSSKSSSAAFEIQKIPKQEPKPKPKPKPKQEPQKAQKSAPAPSISSSLGGVDTGLESFMTSDFSQEESLLGDVDKNVVMSEESVDEPPKALKRVAMEYPKQAKKMGISGYVLMNLLISKDGEVESVKVLESEPAGMFDDVAVEGVKAWKFKPASYKGEAVKVWVKQKIRFDLG